MDTRAPSRQTSRAPTRQASRPPTRQASRPPTRQTNNPALEPAPNAPWPLTKDVTDPASRKWFVLTHYVNPKFLAGTFVVLTQYQDYPNTPTVRPGQEVAPGEEVQRTQENTTYQFQKLNITTKKHVCTTQDGVNAVMSNVVSFQLNGRPVPSAITLEQLTPVYIVGAIPPIHDSRLPRDVPVPLGTRVLVHRVTSREGVHRALQSSSRHPVGTRYLLHVAVETETREWEKCRTSLGSMSFRLPYPSERETIQMLNKRQEDPKVVNIQRGDVVYS